MGGAGLARVRLILGHAQMGTEASALAAMTGAEGANAILSPPWPPMNPAKAHLGTG